MLVLFLFIKEGGHGENYFICINVWYIAMVSTLDSYVLKGGVVLSLSVIVFLIYYVCLLGVGGLLAVFGIPPIYALAVEHFLCQRWHIFLELTFVL